MRKFLIALISISLTTSSAYAASKSPTPKATTKSTAKATAKPSTKPSVKPSAKPTANATVKTTSKATAKATTKATTKSTAKPIAKTTVKATAKSAATKKTVVKKATTKPKPKPKRTKKIPPRTPPAWPPKGFAQKGDIFATVPTAAALNDAAGSDLSGKISAQLRPCEEFSCGAVFAASALGCDWWEIKSEVYGPTSDTDKTLRKYGDLTSRFKGSKVKEVQLFVLVSEEPYNPYFKVTGLNLFCNRTPVPADIQVPSTTYVRVNS